MIFSGTHGFPARRDRRYSLFKLVENDDLKRDIREVERLYVDIKAQKDSLKAELELGATSDSGTEGSSKKRRRLE
jgi:hypothetical protein